jgi:Na+/H+ antiporter NhaD/arsenite permease-like protein
MKKLITVARYSSLMLILAGADLLAKEKAAEAAVATPPDISVFWVLPFIGILLCIAIIPLINAHFWEKNLWWISLGVFCVPMAVIFSVFMGEQLRMLSFEKALDYVSFIILLASLFVISGGILIKGSLAGTPKVNVIFLLIGSVIASIIGTTGASMLLVRPLIRANKDRVKKAHVIIFFIFLVSNIGGSLTPLGDPPLFLGYLQGVPFEWTLRLIPQWAVACTIVLTVFFIMDTLLYRKESPAAVIKSAGGSGALSSAKREIAEVLDMLDLGNLAEQKKVSLNLLKDVRKKLSGTLQKLGDPSFENTDPPGEKLAIEGKINLILIAGVVVIVFLQGLLVKQVSWWPRFGPQEGGMALLLILSLILTPYKSDLRQRNGFTFAPIREVAFLFAGIFAAMIPALYILEHKGAALGITQPWQFFWASGGLSSFLDNAPTYLTFLSLAKGMNLSKDIILNDGGHVSAVVLTAISCGSVFMGANSYIGNGPNFMVKSIAEEQGVKMPSFFGYMVYSIAILIPTFILITLLFFL